MNSKSILIITLLFAFMCSVYSQGLAPSQSISIEGLTTYNKWRFSNKRNYLNDDEQLFRQLIFLDNLKTINKHNSDPNNSYTVGLNQFSDMTEEEFTSRILNNRLSESNSDHLENHETTTFNAAPFANLVGQAVSVDWRSKGAVTAIKNQGSCGSCWTFSSSALMESYNKIKNNKLVNFSTQQLLDCVIPANGYSSYGCNGGWPQQAIAYSVKFGILELTAYPYTAVQGKCKVTSTTTGYKPKTFKKIGTTAADLKNALNTSPVAVLVDASKFGSYRSGIFNGCSSSISLNHAVLAIGYDGSGNWLIKNSWGTGWGESGYMRLAAGATCGVLQDNYIITA